MSASPCVCGPGGKPCGNARPGPYDLSQCRACWRATPENAPKPASTPALPVRRIRCADLGAKVRPVCGCQERHCAKGHGRGAGVRLLVECQTCPDYEAAKR